MVSLFCVCFFFQAEDGIRDIGVTGVQTCALPICRLQVRIVTGAGLKHLRLLACDGLCFTFEMNMGAASIEELRASKIGRASCRERVEIQVGAVTVRKKKEDTVVE